MKHSDRNLLLTFVAVMVAVLTAIVTLRGQEQISDKVTVLENRGQREEFESQFPVIDFESPEPPDLENRVLRQKKNARYDNNSFVNRNDGHSNATESVLFSEWDLGLPAIPTTQSEVIITGDITEAQAYFSNDKTGIYSEFKVTIEKILKNATSAPFAVNNPICVERAGGAVRYPSKGKYLYRISGQGMPRVGKRYVLFLKATELPQTFNIITAYELKGGKVFPLDSAEQFDAYKGIEEATFLDVLRNAIGGQGKRVK